MQRRVSEEHPAMLNKSWRKINFDHSEVAEEQKWATEKEPAPLSAGLSSGCSDCLVVGSLSY